MSIKTCIVTEAKITNSSDLHVSVMLEEPPEDQERWRHEIPCKLCIAKPAIKLDNDANYCPFLHGIYIYIENGSALRRGLYFATTSLS